jgi:hypothetical protein
MENSIRDEYIKGQVDGETSGVDGAISASFEAAAVSDGIVSVSGGAVSALAVLSLYRIWRNCLCIWRGRH